MIDFHNNVFYYYRGSQPTGEQVYDRQLENNTTKALANTLIHTGPEVANKFLDWLGIRGKGKLQVALQSKTIGEHRISGTRHRLLLGITARRAGQEDSAGGTMAEPVEGDGTPDAWLYGDDYVVNDPESASFRCLLRFLLREEEIKYPCLSVRKTIARRCVLSLSDGNVDALVKEVIDIMKAFHPLVKLVNG